MEIHSGDYAYWTCRFQAAWEGHNGRIKELTLGNWGPNKERKPLQVAVQDGKGFTPFAIAIYRRHFGTAKLIVGIANAQFKESDKSKSQLRYEIAADSDCETHDSEVESSVEDGGDGLELYSRVVDETYTYVNVAELQDSVGSKVSGESLPPDMEIATTWVEIGSDNLAAIDMISKLAEVWWFLDKPEKEARDEVGAGQMDVCEALRYGRITSVSQGRTVTGLFLSALTVS